MGMLRALPQGRWQVRYHLEGGGAWCRTFRTKSDALAFMQAVEDNDGWLDRG